MRNAKRIILIVMVIWVGFVAACWGATDPKAVIAGAGPARARVLHFPRDRSLGSLYTITDPGKKSKITQYIGPGIFKYWGEWEYFGEATGDVTVPADKWLQLLIRINKPNPDLSPLEKLGPDDLDMVWVVAIPGTMVNEPDETIMRHLRGLSGLKLLHVYGTGVSSRGLRYIKGLKSLKYLTLFENLDSAALAQLADLTSLKGLFIDSGGVTDRWLRSLAKLPSLEKLFLQAPRVRGPGLAYLAKSPSLKALILHGKPVGRSAGDPLKYLKDAKSLRRLEVADRLITDTGLAQLSGLSKLEELSLYDAQITDAGLAHLKTMHSLKKLVLDRVQGRLTDEGLAHLVEIRTLEELGLPGDVMTDKGLAYLGRLSNLKKISLEGNGFSDEGLAHLERLKFLEELGIGENEHITDGGLAHIGRLTSLESLEIKECANVTGAGLRHIGKLTKLESLEIKECKNVTDAGLAHIGKLTNLERLEIKECKNVTDAGMSHIGKLTNLTSLTLSECPITDEGLAKLAALKSLESIELGLGQATVAGLSHLNEMPRLTKIRAAVGNHGESNLNLAGLTQLKKLDIDECAVHDEDLACLAKLMRLKDLRFEGPISDTGMSHLAALTNLWRLDIGKGDNYEPRLTDSGLSYLRNLSKLGRLTVNGANNFTDKGLRHLEGLTALHTLRIRCKNENPFSRRAVARLRAKLPYLHTFRVNGQRVGDKVVRAEGPRRPVRRPYGERERPVRGRPRRW